jgi:adenylylsulfate kinase-like enzyme
MIVALFGQPHSGKSSLAESLKKHNPNFVNIDGDKLREIFINKDYSRDGRIKNLNKASDIAHYLSFCGTDVVLSLVYPYAEARNYLNSLCSDTIWVYLTYNEERGREKFHVIDFESPDGEKILHLNTSIVSIEDCTKKIISYIYEKITSKSN